MTISIEAPALQERVMDRIPSEILVHILKGVVSCQRETSEATYINDLKALRLCCRTIEPLAAELLFRECWLFMEEASFERLAAVAGHPTHSHRVQTLQIIPTLRSENLLRKEIYRREVKGAALTISNLSWFGLQGDGYRELTEEEVEVGYQEYSRLIDRQTKVRHQGKTALQKALNAFTHLTGIEASPLQGYMDRGHGLSGFSKDTLNTSLGSEDATMVIMAIALSGCPVKKLLLADFNLSGSVGVFNATVVDLSPADLRLAKRTFVGLEELSLRLFKHDEFGKIQLLGSRRARKCQKLLASAHNLTKLLVGDMLTPGLPPIQGMFTTVFNNTHWPRLQDLELWSSMVEQNPLSGLLRRHKATLQRIRLCSMMLCVGTWHAVFAALRKSLLKELKIIKIARYSENNIDFITGFDGGEASEMILEFVHGGEWSPKLDPKFSEPL